MAFKIYKCNDTLGTQIVVDDDRVILEHHYPDYLWADLANTDIGRLLLSIKTEAPTPAEIHTPTSLSAPSPSELAAEEADRQLVARFSQEYRTTRRTPSEQEIEAAHRLSEKVVVLLEDTDSLLIYLMAGPEWDRVTKRCAMRAFEVLTCCDCAKTTKSPADDWYYSKRANRIHCPECFDKFARPIFEEWARRMWSRESSRPRFVRFDDDAERIWILDVASRSTRPKLISAMQQDIEMCKYEENSQGTEE